VRDIYNYYKSNDIETIVMGASFRNTSQIEALAGCDRLTIAPGLMDALASEEGEIKRVLAPIPAEPRSLRTEEDAICHWFVSEDAVDIKHPDPEGPMDETTFRWIMNEDAMATEKLAEGIRIFAHDLKTLRRTIAERLRT
jgi:transaldolase